MVGHLAFVVAVNFSSGDYATAVRTQSVKVFLRVWHGVDSDLWRDVVPTGSLKPTQHPKSPVLEDGAVLVRRLS